MGLVEVVEQEVLTARDTYLVDHAPQDLPHLTADGAALWCKIDHLLYLPLLGLTHLCGLYYYQGAGLLVLYSFTYKYMTMEHFLGQLTRLQLSAALAERLAITYVQSWYPDGAPLTLFVDWHSKPHWTKSYSHTGHVTMWGRVLPGTKQLLLSGPQGRLVGCWDYPIDTHLSHVLVDLEEALEQTLNRPIACTIVDSEGGGLPLGQRYAAAERHYLSVLPQEHACLLADFELEGSWEPVQHDPGHEAVRAHWADPERAAADPRCFVLMRPVGHREPTRVYTGRFADAWAAGEVPWRHRRRWPYSERRIRDLIHGANLNANYGYTYQEVPHRTRLRAWEKAQAQVTVTEQQLSNQQEAVRNLRHRLATLQDRYQQQRATLAGQLLHQRRQEQRGQRLGQPVKRAHQQVARSRQALATCTARFQRQQRHLWEQLCAHQDKGRQLQAQLTHRRQVRDAIDTETLCRERELEKDQLMLNFQILLASLHDWATQTYFAPAWRALSLEKATQMIYRKAGRVTWYDDRIEVELDPYRYADQQRLMEATCARFNAAHRRWRDGRLLRISVAAAPG